LSNTVTLTLKINDNGDLALVSKEAKKAAAGMKGVDEATKKASTSQNNYNRGAKGVGQTGLSASKGFSKMRDSMTGSNGLVGAYATLAANVFALTAAFGALSRASALQQLEKALVATGNAAGANLPYVAKQLRSVTDAAISTEQAMRATAIAVSAGFSSAQLIKLTKVAKGASIALGRDMGDALDRLVRGTAKLEPEILDELGIMVRLDEASATYASTLGKTAAELTRFEKQQAFLNATILEGEKKFETILDLVDPDPYQKLGAAFQDVTKDIINFVNQGLKPVAKFLSDFPSAMYGGILLFGSTIIKQILPALGQMAAGQVNAGKLAAASAVMSARAIEANYVTAANKTKAAFITIPPSLEKMRGAVVSGTLTLKQMEAMVVSLTKSETMRTNLLLNGSAATKTQRELELSQVSQLLVATKAQIALEKTRGTAGATANNLINKSRSSKLQGGLYNKIDKKGAIGGFKVAIMGSKMQAKQVARATGGMGKFAASMNVAGKSAGLMGRAFLNAIPGIGQLLFFGSMLLPLFGDLFKKSKLKETIEEVIESFDSFATASQQLSNYLDGNRTAEERFTASLKVRVGVMDQISSGAARIMEQDDAEHAEKIKTATLRLVAAQEQMIKVKERAFPSIKRLDKANKELFASEKALQVVQRRAGALNVSAAKYILAQSIARLKASKNTKKYAFELAALQKIQEELDDPKQKTMSPDDFQDRVAGAAKPSADLQKSIDEAADYSRKFEDQMVKATKKSSGELGELYDNVLGVGVALEATAANATTLDLVEQSASAVTDAMKVQAVSLFKALGLVKKKGEAEKDMFKRAAAAIAKNNKAMVVQTAEAKALNNESKRYAKFSKESAFFKEHELTAGKKSLEASLTALDAKIANARASNKESSDTNEILGMVTEREDIERKIKDHGDDTNLILQAKTKGEQKLLKLKMKEAGFARAILKISQKTAKNALILLKAQSGSTVEKDDELKVLQAARAEKSPESQAAKLQTSQAKQRIKLEYKLLEIQFDLELARMARLGEEKGWNEEKLKEAQAGAQAGKDLVSNETTGVLGQALTLEDKKAQAKIDADTNRAALLTEEIKREKLSIRMAMQASYSTLLADQGLKELSRYLVLNNLDKEEKQLREDMKGLAKDDISYLRKKLELQDLLNEKLGIEREKRAELLDNLGAGTGSNIGGAAIAAMDTNKAAGDAVVAADKTANDYLLLDGSDPAVAAENAIAAEQARAQATKAGIAGMKTVLDETAVAMRNIGPEGELMASVLEGTSNMTTAFTAAFEVINSDASKMEKVQAGLSAVGSVISSIGAISKAASEQRIRGIDSEIEAEKKRDGSSKQSLAKIAALEKKKDNEKRKQFNMNKKMQMAMTVINTAQAAMGAYASLSVIPFVGPALAAVAAGAIVAMGAMQLSTISATSYQSSGGVSAGGGPSAISMGDRSNKVDIATSQSARGELAYMRGADGTGGSGNFTPAFTGAKYRASGGETAGFMVGEQGPEMFIPDRSGRIAPADEVQAGGAPAQVTFNINTIDASGVEDMLTVQRGNIIGMIRTAANSYGQSFIEEIDTSTLQNNASAMGVGRY
jgi:hypothetical protein